MSCIQPLLFWCSRCFCLKCLLLDFFLLISHFLCTKSVDIPQPIEYQVLWLWTKLTCPRFGTEWKETGRCLSCFYSYEQQCLYNLIDPWFCCYTLTRALLDSCSMTVSLFFFNIPTVARVIIKMWSYGLSGCTQTQRGHKENSWG